MDLVSLLLVSSRPLVTALLFVIVWLGLFVRWAIYEIRHERRVPWGAISVFLAIPACVGFFVYVIFL